MYNSIDEQVCLKSREALREELRDVTSKQQIDEISDAHISLVEKKYKYCNLLLCSRPLLVGIAKVVHVAITGDGNRRLTRGDLEENIEHELQNGCPTLREKLALMPEE